MDAANPESSFASGRPISRRHLFAVGGATVGIAAFLAACANDEDPAPGRVGEAPEPTDPPRVTLTDAVFLRTLQSLEHTIVDVYAELASLDGIDDATSALLSRFTDDHVANATALTDLITEAGGEPYECANPWLMDRQLQPALDNVVGKPAAGSTAAIAPTDDANRDTLAMLNGLETLAQATYQQMVEKLSTPARRAAVIQFGAQAARHAAVAAIVAGGDEQRFVSPVLLGDEVTADENGFTPVFAIPSRFGQLVPIEVTVGALNDLDQRFTAQFETPADNAYVYEGQACPA
jgi:hypothetical protein